MENKALEAIRIVPYGRKYLQREEEMLEFHKPDVRPCWHCGNPVVRGHFCHWCDKNNPHKDINWGLVDFEK